MRSGILTALKCTPMVHESEGAVNPVYSSFDCYVAWNFQSPALLLVFGRPQIISHHRKIFLRQL
jgi:hypothetical protein